MRHNRTMMLPYQIAVTTLLLLFLALVLKNLRDYAAPPTDLQPPRPNEKLFVLIPARNEAANIQPCLDAMLTQDWPNFSLLVLDDNSDDGTDRLVQRLSEKDARLTLLRGEPIPPGWAGKVWACHQLGTEALERGADWLLFLDADTRARPALLRAALTVAQNTHAGMVSAFPYQETETFWERVVLPTLHFLITTFLPIQLVWKTPYPALVAACGQLELFSAETYRAIGGHGSIPRSYHDGLQLARRVKAAGREVRLFDGCPLISCRMYAGGRAVWNGFTRNAYEGLGSFAALLVMTLLQAGLFLIPYLFLAAGLGGWALGMGFPSWGWLCLAQVGIITLIRVLQARRFGHTEAVWLHPLSMLALLAIQWTSFWKTLRKTPVVWKGRVYTEKR